MKILAHRANTDGPRPGRENSLAAVREALNAGYGLETDIRRDTDGVFYISHDPFEVTSDNLATSHAALWRQHPEATIALNVKELGYEGELVAFLEDERVVEQVFLFDMELLGDTEGRAAREFRDASRIVGIAARTSDRDEPVERALAVDAADHIWIDEFDSLWVSQRDVSRLKEQGRLLFAVSPEIHRFSREEARERWRQFLEWGVDGICTDLSDDLSSFLQGR